MFTGTIKVPGITLELLEEMFPGSKGKWREIKDVPLFKASDIKPVDLTKIDLEQWTFKLPVPNEIL